ncbi:hypothetical protein [Alienimonas californiensis]|uniref:Secreted protein n=1 Tax=Alienimonas californiensis TaxID=2527989 RepID=A0A517P5X1_9PLAN|nr:hypothetical protein [Alienimonas californiensis]QDT14755.1 hypothetical protein CA12_08340 [Alienimonas californiensis]
MSRLARSLSAAVLSAALPAATLPCLGALGLCTALVGCSSGVTEGEIEAPEVDEADAAVEQLSPEERAEMERIRSGR